MKNSKFNDTFNAFLLNEGDKEDNNQLPAVQGNQLPAGSPNETQLSVTKSQKKPQPSETKSQEKSQSVETKSQEKSQSVEITNEQLQQIAEKQYNELKNKYKDSKNVKQTIDNICDACLQNKEIDGSKELIQSIESDLQKITDKSA